MLFYQKSKIEQFYFYQCVIHPYSSVLRNFIQVYHLVFFMDHFKIQVHLLKVYLGYCNFSNFEAYYKNTRIDIFLKLKYVISNIFFNLCVRNTKFCHLVFRLDYLKILKFMKFWFILSFTKRQIGTMNSFKNDKK